MTKTLSPLVCPLLIIVLAVGATPAAAASPQTDSSTGLVSTQEALEAERVKSDRELIGEVLNRDEVREQLEAYGVDPGEVEARVAALSDDEVSQLARQLDELPAGAGIGTVLVVLFAVFAVLLVTDILGVTNVYPFTR